MRKGTRKVKDERKGNIAGRNWAKEVTEEFKEKEDKREVRKIAG